MAIIPENRIVAIPSINNANELIPVQRALPTSREESMILTIESPPSPNSTFLKLFSFSYNLKYHLARARAFNY